MISYNKKYNLEKTQEEYEEIRGILDLFSKETVLQNTNLVLSTAGIYMNPINLESSDKNYMRDKAIEILKEHMDWAEEQNGHLEILIVAKKHEEEE